MHTDCLVDKLLQKLRISCTAEIPIIFQMGLNLIFQDPLYNEYGIAKDFVQQIYDLSIALLCLPGSLAPALAALL